MDALAELFNKANTNVDIMLDTLIPGVGVEPSRLHEAMRWSLFAGGKRIRPAIVFAVGSIFAADSKRLARTAAAIEMIHTFSLIHDDLPVMDNDDLRRGRATCHKKYGEATAILAGDALLALAFEAIASDDRLGCGLRVRLVADIAAASATPTGMVAGQQLDLEAEGASVSHEALEGIHRRKTGALIAASARAGALIGEARSDELSWIEKYAERLGLLFQITDDLLDVTQATETLGKTAGKDEAAAKATYPAYFGIGATREMVLQTHKDACDALDPLDYDTGILRDLAAMIAGRTS